MFDCNVNVWHSKKNWCMLIFQKRFSDFVVQWKLWINFSTNVCLGVKLVVNLFVNLKHWLNVWNNFEFVVCEFVKWNRNRQMTRCTMHTLRFYVIISKHEIFVFGKYSVNHVSTFHLDLIFNKFERFWTLLLLQKILFFWIWICKNMLDVVLIFWFWNVHDRVEFTKNL